jgi:hypothetical protein
MADWRKVAKAFALSDGRIDTKETTILRKELFADGKIDKSELEFLYEIRKGASSTVRDFTELFIEAVKANVLTDGKIDAAEAAWLKKAIFADDQVDADEKRLLAELKAGAKSTCPEFVDLCKQCGVLDKSTAGNGEPPRVADPSWLFPVGRIMDGSIPSLPVSKEHLHVVCRLGGNRRPQNPIA